MSRTVSKLKKLLSAGPAATTGTMVYSAGARASVSTSSGIVSAATQNIYYKNGDKVRILNGVVVGKLPDENTLDMYFV
jgi:hypothetical protein